MSKRTLIIAAAVLTSAAVVLAADPQPVFAGTSEIGKNVGEEVRSWATTLLLGVAGLVAIPVLARRDVNGGLVLALLVLIVGGFVFAQGSVKDVITGIWKAIGE